MNVRKQLLALGTELLRAPVLFVISRRDRVKLFALPQGAWACLLSEAQSETSWYFRPLFLQDSSAGSAKDGSDISNESHGQESLGQESLGQDDQLTEKLRNSMRSVSNRSHQTDFELPCFIASHRKLGAILVVQCGEFRLVADALHSWGMPSETVAQDWKNQRIRLAASVPDLESVHTAETFVSEDGILIPILPADSMATDSFADQSMEHLCRLDDFKDLATCLVPAQDWPEPAECTLHCNPESLEFDPNSDVQAPPTTRTPKRRPLFKAGIAIAILLVVTFFLFVREMVPNSKTDQELGVGSAVKSQLKLDADRKNEVIAPTPNDAETWVADSDFSLDESQSDTTPADSGEMTIASLEAQMKTNLGDLAMELSATSSSIVQESLKKQGESEPSSWTEWSNLTSQGSVLDSDGNESAEVKRTRELVVTPSENGAISLEKPIVFTSAWTRESISVGKPVHAKECRCVVEIKAPKSVAVEPYSAVSIEGNSKQSWRFAIEDEDPELVVELVSKPGIRWQIFVAVGVREFRGASPVMLQPRDAQNVCNKLVLHNQWLDQRIALLQKSKTNKRDQWNRDLVAEIKRMASEQKDTVKAIERWRFIANLSHQFYDQVAMKVDFFPAEKK